MGFALFEPPAKRRDDRNTTALCHEMGCQACPLDRANVRHPKMEPTGSKEPIIYVLGEAPGRQEDNDGVQFIGASGEMLRKHLPRDLIANARWNNVIRTRPPDNRKPTEVEIECCRPSIERDIEAAAPVAIFGFGDVPLQWVKPGTAIRDMRGRRFPVRIGNHVCWFYSFNHPASILHMRGSDSGRERGMAEQQELIFKFDIKRAVATLMEGTESPFMTRAQAEADIEIIRPGHEGLIRLRELIDMAKRLAVCGYDYETTDLRPFRPDDKILTIGIGTPTINFAYPFDHPRANWSESEHREVHGLTVDLLRAPVVKAVHNQAFEMEWTAVEIGEEHIRTKTWSDTQSRGVILDDRDGGRLRDNQENSGGNTASLDFLCQLYFGVPLKSYSSVDRKNMLAEPLDKTLRYNALDGKFHRLVHQEQQRDLDREDLNLAAEMMEARVPTVVLTQIKGVHVDVKANADLDKEYARKIEHVEDRISKTEAAAKYLRVTGKPFVPAHEAYSNKDVIVLVRDVLKSKAGAGALGKWSVDEKALKEIDDPIVPLLLEHREVCKMHATYILPLSPGARTLYPDGRLHPIFNTNVARTGRLTCENPNLQNIPVRNKELRKIRAQIAAKLGHTLFAVDLGQIEARLIAMASRDRAFVKALWERYDVHMEWAQRIAHAYPRRIGGKAFLNDKDVMKTFRSDVKNQWTFPLFFGAEIFTVERHLNIPAEYLQPLVDEFWQQFEGVHEWQAEIKAFYLKHGYVTGLTGRRYRGPLSDNQIYNYPIQGPTCDIVMESMNRLSQRADPAYQPILQIHDDLTFELPDERLEECADTILSEMLDVRHDFVNVPITLEAKVGQSWYEMEEIGSFSSDEWKRAA